MTPAHAAEDSLGSPNKGSAETEKKKSQQPSKGGPRGRSRQHHPEHPEQLPNTTGPIVTDSAITQADKAWSSQITPALNIIGGVFNSNWQRRSPGANQTTRKLQVKVSYGADGHPGGQEATI